MALAAYFKRLSEQAKHMADAAGRKTFLHHPQVYRDEAEARLAATNPQERRRLDSLKQFQQALRGGSRKSSAQRLPA
jgi:hypothetical protein